MFLPSFQPALSGCSVGHNMSTCYVLTPRLTLSLRFLRPGGMATKKGVSKALRTLQDVLMEFQSFVHTKSGVNRLQLTHKKRIKQLACPGPQAHVLTKVYEFW